MKHNKLKHPEKCRAWVESGLKARQAKAAKAAKAPDPKDSPKDSPRDSKGGAKLTTDYRQANYWAYMPKKFEFSSALLGLAKQVSMEAWGWPDYDMADGTFIDTFIFHMLQLTGIKVKSWERVSSPAETEEEEDSNGQGEIAALQTTVLQLDQKFDTLLNLIAKAVANSKGGG